MDVQLRFKRTNRFCFITDATSKKKEFGVQLEFARFERFTKDKDSDGEIVTDKVEYLPMQEFLARWEQMKAEGWKIDIVS